MKKYNLSKIMKRAWEIKEAADRKSCNQLRNHNVFRELEESEKAPFSICLKLAWEEAKKAVEYAEKLNISMDNALVITAKETELIRDYSGNVTWKIWKNYGKFRAYYTVDTRSKYANNKKSNFVELVA